MMHEEICTYEVAKLAKNKRFPQHPKENDNCQIYCWDNLRKIHSLCVSTMWYTGEFNREDMYAAPTQSLLQKWLREEKDIHISVEYEWVENFDGWTFWAYIKQVKDERVIDDAIKGGFNTYELALEDALQYALENLI